MKKNVENDTNVDVKRLRLIISDCVNDIWCLDYDFTVRALATHKKQEEQEEMACSLGILHPVVKLFCA